MIFLHWPFLLGIPCLLVCFQLWKRLQKTPSLPYSVAIPQELKHSDPLSFFIFLRLLGLIFLLFALARPQHLSKTSERKLNGIDIMMLLDVSASMNIEDLGTSSRLEEAKKTIEGFVSGRRNDRIGLAIFSGEPLSMAPPTLDYPLLLNALQQVTTGVLQDGTAIGDGLALAVSHLKESKAKSRVIILLTDGDNNLGQVDPATAGELAKGFGIRVYTIAIGREGRVKMPVKRQGLMGDVVSYQWFDNALNPTILKQIAEVTSAKFYRVTDATTLAEVFKEIDQLETSEIQSNEKIKTQELFLPFLTLGFLFLLLERICALCLWRFCP